MYGYIYIRNYIPAYQFTACSIMLVQGFGRDSVIYRTAQKFRRHKTGEFCGLNRSFILSASILARSRDRYYDTGRQ